MIYLYILLINAIVLLSAYLWLPQHPYYFSLMALAAFLSIYFLLRRHISEQLSILASLKQGMLNLLDGEFALSLPEQKKSSLNDLVNLFNQTANKLRTEKQHLYQREIMLDKVLNASPILTILVNHRQDVVFVNRAALHYFGEGKNIIGMSWKQLTQNGSKTLQQAVNSEGDCIYTLPISEDAEDAWHLSSSSFSLHQLPHKLIMLKRITEQLTRQEIKTWKKVIRVISHELNNSIAPISSLCHSGSLVASQFDDEKLARVFSGISRRVEHLNDFVKGYSKLAKLKAPEKSPHSLNELLKHIRTLYDFTSAEMEERVVADFDVTQIEQVLINLLKNAVEASPDSKPQVIVQQKADKVVVMVKDNGPGMSSEVLQNALLPFYSTKPSGSGLGLTLSREIVEAHGGTLSLKNSENLGLEVSFTLPSTQSKNEH